MIVFTGIRKLKEAYPDFKVEGPRTLYGETTIEISGSNYIKHIEVEVPPGCYLVRAFVCDDNLWTDRAMAIVDGGEDACVHLIVPRKEACIRNVLVPNLIAAQEMHLDPRDVEVATPQ